MSLTDPPAEILSAQNPKIVWRSTRESVDNGIPSILAFFEVAISVIGYWAIAIYFHTSTHLWISICVAPLLLLRSNQSTSLGIRWFKSYYDDEWLALFLGAPTFRPKKSNLENLKKWSTWILVVASIVASVFVSYSLSEWWFSEQNSWAIIFLKGIAFGFFASMFCHALFVAIGTAPVGLSTFPFFASLVVLGTKAGFVAIFGVALSIIISNIITLFSAINPLKRRIVTAMDEIRGRGDKPEFRLFLPVILQETKNYISGDSLIAAKLGLSIALGIWIRSLAIRVGATFLYWHSGFWGIPKNFVQNLFVIDVLHHAELVPGYKNGGLFTSSGVAHSFVSAHKRSEKVLYAILFLFFFIPAYAYRLTIKSTCWLYLPLVYVSSERYSALAPDHLLDRLRRSPWERLRRFFALGSLAAFVLTTAVHNLSNFPIIIEVNSVSPIEFLFLIDFQFWKRPWQLCSLLSVFITIYLIGAAGHARVDLEHAVEPQSKALFAKEIEQIKLLMRGRDVSSAILVLILFVHALLLFSPVVGYLPTHVLDGLSWFYGTYMPPMP